MSEKEIKANAAKPRKCPLYKLEFIQSYKSLIIWTIVCIVLMALYIGLWPALQLLSEAAGGAGIEDMGIAFPAYLLAQLGSGWVFIGVLYGSVLGCSLVNSNFRNGSLAMLYTQNFTRNRILSIKFLRGLENLVIFNIISAFAILAIVYIIGQSVYIGNFFIATLFATLASLISFILVFGIAALIPKKIKVLYVVIISLVLYLIVSFSALGAMNIDGFGWLAWFSPIGLFTDPVNYNVLLDGFLGINYIMLSVWAGLAVAAIVPGFLLFKKHDLV